MVESLRDETSVGDGGKAGGAEGNSVSPLMAGTNYLKSDCYAINECFIHRERLLWSTVFREMTDHTRVCMLVSHSANSMPWTDCCHGLPIDPPRRHFLSHPQRTLRCDRIPRLAHDWVRLELSLRLHLAPARNLVKLQYFLYHFVLCLRRKACVPQDLSTPPWPLLRL